MVVLSLAGLGQVLEFMYTAKLSLSSENVDDVLAVASFLQIQDIVSACHALKSLAEPVTSAGENPEVPPAEGRIIGDLFLSRWLHTPFLRGALPLALRATYAACSPGSAGRGWPQSHLRKVPGPAPLLPLHSTGQGAALASRLVWGGACS